MIAAAARDTNLAQDYLDLYNNKIPRISNGPERAAKGYPCLTGLAFSEEIDGEDPIVYTEANYRKYPGVHGGIGEVTEQEKGKEIVAQASGQARWSIKGIKFKRWLDWYVGNKIKAPINLHMDWGHAGLTEEGRPAAIQQAYENVQDIIDVFGDPKYKDVVIVLAHAGTGRYVRPNAKPEHWQTVWVVDRATGRTVERHVPEQVAKMYEIAKKVPNAKFDISWNDVT